MAAPAAPPASAPLLVVDDEIQAVRSLEISFMDELEVLTATSGEQASRCSRAAPTWA
ncbi:MAG: hypothetical protein IPK07_26990 [Deltaproteobacteria bacterium]|nr:hypothetical protein [Deltaproteobacteria bacterium]